MAGLLGGFLLGCGPGLVGRDDPELGDVAAGLDADLIGGDLV
jgi:hypothetical protein